MEKETIRGFNIPKRKLTHPEKVRPITWERIESFLYDVGEDLFDQVGSYLVNGKVFLGYLMAKEPKLVPDLLEAVNTSGDDLLDMMYVFEEHFESGWKPYYTHFADFANLTVTTKARTNEILIHIEEHYNPKTVVEQNEKD